MTDPNPYSAPEAELEQSPAGDRFTLTATPRSRSMGRGWRWINAGFEYFRRSWGPWIGAMVLGFVIMIVVSLIPVVNLLAQLLTFFVWNAGIAIGCRAQAEGRAFKVSHLWAGFFNRVGVLILLSAIYNIALFAIGFIAVIAFSPQLLTPEAETLFNSDPYAAASLILLPVLVAIALTLPLVMATLFAPHLIVFHALPLLSAIKLSFIGCLKNILPFLAWGIGFLVLLLALALVVGLVASLLNLFAIVLLVAGLVALTPVMFASIYLAYEDIFLVEGIG